MRSNSLFTYVAAAACLGLAGCASDGSSILTTASVQPAKQPVVAAVDPACLALQNRIDLLREEGTVAKVEKAASGKTKTVVIKRAALSKVAEFNQANAEFRQRCSKLPPQRTASIAKPAPVATTAQVPATPQPAAAAAQKPQVAAEQAATLTRQ
ncbi:MAG: hypothetical protein AAGD43_24880 [Pseudomonadota bacterium]